MAEDGKEMPEPQLWHYVGAQPLADTNFCYPLTAHAWFCSCGPSTTIVASWLPLVRIWHCFLCSVVQSSTVHVTHHHMSHCWKGVRKENITKNQEQLHDPFCSHRGTTDFYAAWLYDHAWSPGDCSDTLQAWSVLSHYTIVLKKTPLSIFIVFYNWE